LSRSSRVEPREACRGSRRATRHCLSQPCTPVGTEIDDPMRVVVPSEKRERGTSPLPSLFSQLAPLSCPAQIGTPVRTEIAVTQTKQTTATLSARYTSKACPVVFEPRRLPDATSRLSQPHSRVAQIDRAASERTSLAFVVAPRPDLAIMGRSYSSRAHLLRRQTECPLR
jgi:hypothetical protein